MHTSHVRARDQYLQSLIPSGNSARAFPRLGSCCPDKVNSCARTLPGSLDRLNGFRGLFLPHVGMRGSVKHLFEEFQNSLWDRWENYQDVPEERRESHHSRLHQIAHGTRKRKALLPRELQSLREVLCELLSDESCGEWLGFNDLSRPDTKPPLRRLAGLIREPDWTDGENIHKLRMYRAAAFVDCLRPNVLDWETPRTPDRGPTVKLKVQSAHVGPHVTITFISTLPQLHSTRARTCRALIALLSIAKHKCGV
jgi:hypothetical protein